MLSLILCQVTEETLGSAGTLRLPICVCMHTQFCSQTQTHTHSWVDFRKVLENLSDIMNKRHDNVQCSEQRTVTVIVFLETLYSIQVSSVYTHQCYPCSLQRVYHSRTKIIKWAQIQPPPPFYKYNQVKKRRRRNVHRNMPSWAWDILRYLRHNTPMVTVVYGVWCYGNISLLPGWQHCARLLLASCTKLLLSK